MNSETPQDNWLGAAHIECPHCHEPLYRVDHSPLADDWQLYCDICANCVVVSFYDPVVVSIQGALPAQDRWDYHHLMAAIEQRLRPCSCGGHYRHDAARRCCRCLTPVITNESDVDLWPTVYGLDVEARDPTAEEIGLVEWFEARHVRRGSLWA
jgi:hypothetical protein